MTPIERQILKNQATILKGLTGMSLTMETLKSISDRLLETSELLLQEKSEEPTGRKDFSKETINMPEEKDKEEFLTRE